MRINSKKALISFVTDVVAGTKKHLPNGSEVLTLAGGAETPTVDQVTLQLQTLITNRAAVIAAEANAEAKHAAEEAQMGPLIALLDAFVALIRIRFGADPTAMADFGIEPRKVPAPRTAEQKAAAAAKAKATRQARGTTSAKQKKAIKGNVTATLVVMPAAPSTVQAPVVAPAAATTPAKS